MNVEKKNKIVVGVLNEHWQCFYKTLVFRVYTYTGEIQEVHNII